MKRRSSGGGVSPRGTGRDGARRGLRPRHLLNPALLRMLDSRTGEIAHSLPRVLLRGLCPVRSVTSDDGRGVRALSELAAAGCVATGGDQEADVAFVDPGDGLAEADGRMVGEAGR
jgi:hypothetical protein